MTLRTIYVCYNRSPDVCPRVEAFNSEKLAEEWVQHMRNYPGMEEGWVVMPTELHEGSAVPVPPL